VFEKETNLNDEYRSWELHKYSFTFRLWNPFTWFAFVVMLLITVMVCAFEHDNISNNFKELKLFFTKENIDFVFPPKQKSYGS
jgi:hypothetical protein